MKTTWSPIASGSAASDRRPFTLGLPVSAVEHGRGQVEIADAATHEIGRAEQPRGGGVRDRHHAVRAVREHAVADAVEHGRLILHERGELLGLQAEGEALEAAPEHERHDRAERDGEQRGQRDAASSSGSSWNTLAGAKPTLTSPTGSSVSGSRTGTFARADSPSVPDSHATVSRPASASAKLVLTTSPSSSGSGWARRMP